jgi:hypothetical protein
VKSDKHLIKACGELVTEMNLRVTALRVLDGGRNPGDSHNEALQAVLSARRFLKHTRALVDRYEARAEKKGKR